MLMLSFVCLVDINFCFILSLWGALMAFSALGPPQSRITTVFNQLSIN